MSFELYRDLQANKGTIAIGIDHLQKYVDLLLQQNEPLISIGSGLGLIEAYFEKKNNKMICIDPDPAFWHEKTDKNKHLPDYKTIFDLLETNPTIYENCNLFINWPYPNGICDGYDIESIVKLKPQFALLVVETTGSSGSAKLLYSLRSLDESLVSREDVVGRYKEINLLSDYEIEYVTTTEDKVSLMGQFLFRYILLRRKNVESLDINNIPKEVEPAEIYKTIMLNQPINANPKMIEMMMKDSENCNIQ